MGDIVSKAGPDDVPIKPAETIVLKIHPGQVPAWEKSVREGTHPEARRLQIKMEALSFGDGTGYFGTEPYPPAGKWQLALIDQPEEPPTTSPSMVSQTQARIIVSSTDLRPPIEITQIKAKDGLS